MAINMTVTDEGIRVIYNDEQGIAQTKLIDLADLASILANQARLDTGLLPAGTRQYTRTESYELLVIEVPAHTRTLKFRGTTDYILPMPRTLHTIKFMSTPGGGKRFLGSHVHCLKQPLISPQTPLFKFPYGNVGGDGYVCWGSINVPTFDNLAGLGAMPDIFLGSSFNGDLGGGAFQSFRYTAEDGPLKGTEVNVSAATQLMAYLHNKPEFPERILNPTTTFNEFIHLITR